MMVDKIHRPKRAKLLPNVLSKEEIKLILNSSQRPMILIVKKSGQKIALIGALANDKNSPLGSWRIAASDDTAVSVLEGMQQYKDNKLTFEKGADLLKQKATF